MKNKIYFSMEVRKMRKNLLIIAVMVCTLMVINGCFNNSKNVPKMHEKEVMETLINYSIIKNPEDVKNYFDAKNENSTVIEKFIEYNNKGKKAYDDYVGKPIRRLRERLIILDENL